MTVTTIKVSTELRDRLKREAERHGRTMSGEIEALLEDALRRYKFEQLARAMEATPPDEAYLAEAAEWQSDAWN